MTTRMRFTMISFLSLGLLLAVLSASQRAQAQAATKLSVHWEELTASDFR
jgi:hypothetical protein